VAKRTWWDKALGSIGLQRRRSEAAYRGANMGALNRDWIMGPISADQALRFDMMTLRQRARELVINDPVAARIPRLFSENVVGEHGFTFQAKIGNSRKGMHEGLNLSTETAFYDWADNFCTVDGRQSFAEVQSMAAENEVTDGEFIVRLVRGFDNPYGFALELIDPDQLDHTLNIPDTGRGTSIRMGVEVDKWRRPVAYHLLKHHPSERGARSYNVVPADDVIHLYHSSRVQQTRGVTHLAPVILNIKMLSGGREAVLVAMRAAACNSVTYETAEGYEPPPGTTDSTTAVIPTDLEPGAGYELPPGITAHFNNPPFADAAFDPFERGILRSTSQALGVSYSSMSGDLTQASYGSQRAGLLPEQAAWRKLQRRMIRKFLTPVYRAFIQEALLSGALPIDGQGEQKYWNVVWHPRAFEWIDPLKDAEAEDTKIGMGLQSLTRLANANGDDINEIIAERKTEIEAARAAGVPLFVGGIDVTGQFQQQAGKGAATATGDTGNARDQQKVETPAHIRVLSSSENRETA
jgi:lambda family phage portal protein